MKETKNGIGSLVTRIRLAALLSLGVLSVVAVALSACGGSNNNSGQAEAAPDPADSAGNGVLTVTMNDYSFAPENATTTAGSVVIKASNEGKVLHELVVFKTSADPAKLPEANGEVDEDKLAQVSEEAGEIEDVAAGETKSGKFELTPGAYVMFCNIPGHYDAGMYGTLTVTK